MNRKSVKENSERSEQTMVFKDRKVAMIGFGIFQIFLGAVCALMVPTMIVALVASGVQPGVTEDHMNIGSIIAVLAYLCRGIYKLEVKAWRTAVMFVILVSLSAIITFMNTSLRELYEKINYTPSQIELMEKYDFLQSPDMVVYTSLIMLIFLIYLVYTRKFFVTKEDGG